MALVSRPQSYSFELLARDGGLETTATLAAYSLDHDCRISLRLRTELGVGNEINPLSRWKVTVSQICGPTKEPSTPVARSISLTNTL